MSAFTDVLANLRARATAINAAITALEAAIAPEIDEPAAPATTSPTKPGKAGTKSKTSPPPAKNVPRVLPVARTTQGAADGMNRVHASVVAGYRHLNGIVKATKLPYSTVYGYLTRLVRANRLSMVKVGRVWEYRVVAAPAKPKPADDELVPVWSGTKERKGEAPSLSSVSRA